jgi:IS5 family transposase
VTPRQQSRQTGVFSVPLERIVDPGHPLCALAGKIDWREFDVTFGSLYDPGNGRPGTPTRLMVGLHYLKHTFNQSDEAVVARWVENPYWQYFCGMTDFTHEFPIDPSMMTKWRNRLKSDGMEKLLEGTIRAGLATGVIDGRSFAKVNVDTTVQEKAITYPTDAKLYHKMREKLVAAAEILGIDLRQSYRFLSKNALFMQGRYSASRQPGRSRREVKKVKNYFGRVLRDIGRKLEGRADTPSWFTQLVEFANSLHAQKRDDKGKIYSIHAPEVECISKGKAHKKWEFGCKASVAASSRDNFVLGIHAVHGSPYDGHTLAGAIEQVERLSGRKVGEVFVDKGYRGHDYTGSAIVHVAKRGMKKLDATLRKWMKRRAAIEPVIGHIKNDGRLGRNYLKGAEGDRMNAILSGCGYNMRKLLRRLLFLLFFDRSAVCQALGSGERLDTASNVAA